ncbi:MAG TPA: hypothetical protein VF062_28780 [Candidatus Limnocylindrales bacterium]
MFHLLATAALVAGLMPAATAAAATPQADLAIDLRARDGILLISLHYTVAVTNRGPQALTSATVTLLLDSDAGGVLGSPCTFNAANDTATCPVGGLAPGATATVSATILFNSGMPPGPVAATAVRSASMPADPFAGNDSDSATCIYEPVLQPLDPPPDMRC